MPTKSNKKIVFEGIAFFAVAVLALWYWNGPAHLGANKATGAATIAATDEADKPANTEPKSGKKEASISDSSISVKDDVIRYLSGHDKNRWLVAQRDYFPQLAIDELWDVLNTSGIANQVQSKAIRDDLLLACARFNSRENATAPLPGTYGQSLGKSQCSLLMSRGDWDYFVSQARSLTSDSEYQSSPYVAPGPDYAALKGQQYSDQQALEESRLTQMDDPWLAARGVRALWWMRSPDMLGDWNEIAGFNPEQRDQIMQTLAVDRACAMISGCGPNSVWTISYCSLVFGTQCPPGMSYDQIVQMNLSQAQLDVRQKILVNLMNRFPIQG